MFESNAISGAGDLLSEIDAQLAEASGPATAFTLMMQRQALADRISFKRWLNHNNMLIGEQVDQHNQKAARAVALTRRASYAIGSF